MDTGYKIARGKVTRKLKAGALAAITVGPALATIVLWFLMEPLALNPPEAVQTAIGIVCEFMVILVIQWATPPSEDDIPVPASTPDNAPRPGAGIS